jgi:hypothetical protein
MESMKEMFAQLPSNLSRAYVAESRVIFWNLLLTILLSSLVLVAYLEAIFFDF